MEVFTTAARASEFRGAAAAAAPDDTTAACGVVYHNHIACSATADNDSSEQKNHTFTTIVGIRPGLCRGCGDLVEWRPLIQI